MHSFTFDGTEYRSLSECCQALKISYQKVRRLCRHYKRAHEDPAVAVRWTLGTEKRSPSEEKTAVYRADLRKSSVRQERFRDALVAEGVRSFE